MIYRASYLNILCHHQKDLGQIRKNQFEKKCIVCRVAFLHAFHEMPDTNPNRFFLFLRRATYDVCISSNQLIKPETLLV